MKPQLHAFDFDGTITTRDTFLAFIRHTVGIFRFYAGMAVCAPLIAKMFLHIMPTQEAKEAVFAHFFKGMSIDEFNARCRDFAEKNRHLLRPDALTCIKTVLEKGESVLIVSASIENYIAPFFEGTPVQIEATKVALDGENRLTGKFSSANCKGEEKVRRILARFPERTTYTLVAYGDSSGDREMLILADESHFKPFRRGGGIAEKIRYLLTGGIAVAVQYVAYRALLTHCSITVSYTLAFAISLALNFVLSSFFTFRVRPSAKKAAGFCLSHAINYALQVALLHLCIKIGIHKNFAPVPVYAVCIPINFVLVKFFLTQTQAHRPPLSR